MARRRRPAPPATATPPEGCVYVLWRHQYDDFEILGVFTSPEKFQAYVAKRFPKTRVGSVWRRGESQWVLSTPQWEFVASLLMIDDQTLPPPPQA